MIIKFTPTQIKNRKDIARAILKAMVNPQFASEQGDRYLQMAAVGVKKMQRRYKQ